MMWPAHAASLPWASGQMRPRSRDDAAIADYEKSIDHGAFDDGCTCDPYSPLLGLYEKDRLYDRSWVLVRRATAAGKWIAPDLLERLRKESGRKN